MIIMLGFFFLIHYSRWWQCAYSLSRCDDLHIYIYIHAPLSIIMMKIHCCLDQRSTTICTHSMKGRRSLLNNMSSAACVYIISCTYVYCSHRVCTCACGIFIRRRRFLTVAKIPDPGRCILYHIRGRRWKYVYFFV